MQAPHVVIDAALEANEGCSAQLAELLRATQQACATEAGCLTYRFTRDLESDDSFHVLEIWASEADFNEHKVGGPFRAFIEGLSHFGRLVSATRRIGPLKPFESAPQSEPEA